jgi:hypothetical protein
MEAVANMIRQQRRRLDRQWSEIKVGEICTTFIEQNNLLTPPHIISFQALKISEDLAIVYNVGLFDFKKGKGHGEFLTTCMFVDGCLRNLGSERLGFVQEFDLWEVDEID